MASIAYKCIRRSVNLLAFLLLVETLIIVVYSFYSKILNRLEVYVLSSETGFSSVINYLVGFSLFMTMVSSTAVNSKSKFTIKIAIIFGVFFFLFSLGCFAYIKLSYADKLLNAVYCMSTRTRSDELTTIMNMIGAGNIIRSHKENMRIVVEAVQREIYIFMIMFTCYYSISGFITIFMILGSNCKISTPKKNDEEQEVEVITQTVGFTGKSLRRYPLAN
ncbi:hypothetical protein NEMIN01_0674 [Nematocida minor]|uniref:uncharacterized protein n=1 Tax=Nematocida minor TaxID=1912983 RepID=UPI002220B854|nr:uncharacterized protein NEMIN01_0674 [Nematocida minor]KAI5189721.1 hypothetical protein NEMIN01_0674 [Nematocida minor]